MRIFRYHILLFLTISTTPSFAIAYGLNFTYFSLGEKAGFTDEPDTKTIEMLSPGENEVYKRGDALEIRWTGGNPEDQYALDLYSGKYHYLHIGELKNSGVYPWIIPKDAKPGKEFKFKLTNTNDFSDFSFGQSFEIKRRVPIVAWIVPGGLLITGAVILLLKEDPITGPNDLPVPIDP